MPFTSGLVLPPYARARVVPVGMDSARLFHLGPANLAASGNEITDAVRSVGNSGDRAAVPGGYGIWPATTPGYVSNFSSSISGWTALLGTETLTRPATPIVFNQSHSLDVTTPATAGAHGAFVVYSNAAIGSNVWSGGVWFLGTLGAGYTIFVNGTAGAHRATANFTGTGAPQYVSITAQMSSDSVFILGVNRQSRAGVESFSLGTAQIEAGFPTPFIGEGASTRAAGRVQVPASVLSPVQGWVAAYVVPGFASASLPNAAPRIFGWTDGTTNNRIDLEYNAGSLGLVRSVGGSAVTASQSATFAANVGGVTIGVWTPAQLAASFNGAAFATAPQAAAPAGTQPQWDIGSIDSATAGQELNGRIVWLASGIGTLSNADAATINGWGATPPTLARLYALNNGDAQPTLLWTCATASALAAA